jgi:glycosyltransferase involved in cell wall biosynthesis
MHISVVSPVYKAPTILPELVERLRIALTKITDSFEIILVDDGCPWNSWSLIEELSKKHSFIKGLKLSRNFGQHHAITAGLDCAKGEWIVVMDCDLQDRPEEIPKLYIKALEGFDIVFARRVNRQDNFKKKLSSLVFYKIFSYLSGIEQDGTIGNFGIFNRKVIAVINQMREPMRAFLPMAKWVGFNTTKIDILHDERFDGRSSYNLSKLLQLALDASIAYSDKPLKLTIKLGFTISLISVFYAAYNLSVYLLGFVKLSGYTSIIISIWFLSGLIIFTLGILGLYVSKIFEGIKARPLYIIDINLNNK